MPASTNLFINLLIVALFILIFFDTSSCNFVALNIGILKSQNDL